MRLNFQPLCTAGCGVLTLVGAAITMHGCAGPQPLDKAIHANDEQAYLGAMSDAALTPREAFYRARAGSTGMSVEEVKAQDVALSTTKNPFSARHDPEAVSQGAVLYKYNCMNCHGANADGHGSDVPTPTDEMNFHKFSTRFAVTLHGGAPSKWFRIINDGTTSAQGHDANGQPLVMEPFSDKLAREQIWLIVTYLQSLGD